MTVVASGVAVLSAAVMVAAGLWELANFAGQAHANLDQLMRTDLEHLTVGVYNTIRARDEALRLQLAGNLSVAQDALARAGGLNLAADTVRWSAVNQFTQAATVVELPRALVGGRWLGQNTDPAAPTAVVDEVTRLVGGAATLFQRMNAAGDMLRVATTVPEASGQRAIGTFLPALNPDGQPNPVVAAVLRGDTYQGLAWVVNAWYLTRYAPLQDASGQTIGMLFVGLRQDEVQAFEDVLYGTRVGQTGYVYILGGQGEDRGHYIVSRNGERDGEDVWETRDADGRPVIQDIVAAALPLKPGETTTLRYRWQNPGEPAPRWKVAQVAYFAPYDWVIGVGVYEDEYIQLQAGLTASQRTFVWVLFGAGLLLALGGGLAAAWVARGIAAPLAEMVRAADALAAGEVDHELAHASQDEAGRLAAAFRRMTANARETAALVARIAAGDLRVRVTPRSAGDRLGHGLVQMAANLEALVGEAAGDSRQVRQAAGDLAQAAEQAGLATRQIAQTIGQVAQGNQQQTANVARTATALASMRQAIDGVAEGAQEQAAAVEKSTTLATGIVQAVQQVAGNAAAVTQEAGRAAEAAQVGSRTVADTLAGLLAVRARVRASAEKMREMVGRSDQVGAIVETIDDIAGQTNLLALNAAIEAARAGQHGRGFAVVADEVRQLAERASAATKEIGGLIRAIQAAVGEAGQALDQSAAEVAGGAERAQQAGAALEQILRAADSARAQAVAAGQAAQQMTEAAHELTWSMEAVGAIVEANRHSTQALTAEAGAVAEAMEGIASVSEESSAAAEEVAAGASQMRAQVEGVSQAARQLTALAEGLQAVVTRFQINGDSAPPPAAVPVRGKRQPFGLGVP